MESERTRRYRRLRYEGREILGRLADPPANANIYTWFEGCLNNLHRQLCSRGVAIDFIGVTINSEIFNHGPLWLSFRPINDFNAEDLWGLLSSGIQSAIILIVMIDCQSAVQL